MHQPVLVVNDPSAALLHEHVRMGRAAWLRLVAARRALPSRRRCSCRRALPALPACSLLLPLLLLLREAC